MAGLLAIALPVSAATYYIDGATGSDTNPGTMAQPWKTFSKADSSGLQPGDIVMVQAGTYNTGEYGILGPILDVSNGTQAQPITYKAQGKVIITNPVSEALPVGGIAILIKTDWTVFEGFEAADSLYGLEWAECTGGTARNCIARNCRDRGLAAVAVDSPTFENNLLIGGDPANCWCIHVEACTGTARIVNNTIDSGRVGIIVFAGSAVSTVKNNIVAHTTYALDHNQASPIVMDNSHNLLFANEMDYLYRVSLGPGEFHANPRWVNPGGDDYTLDSLSTAINTGTPVGLPYNGPLPDIGAFETTSTSLPGAAVGRVTNVANGQPLAGATVSDSDDTSWGVTDANGDYRTLLAPGSYTLKASRPGYSQQTASVVISANADTPKNFALTRLPAKTYHVNGSTGNDSNDGSAGSPWKTIARGDELGILNPGDTVLIAPGTYAPATKDGIKFTKNSGEPGLPISYLGDGGVVVVDNSANQPNTDVYGIQSSVSYLKFDGFEVRNCQYGFSFGIEHPGNEVSNCYIHDLSGPSGSSRGISVNLNSGVYAHNNVIANITNTSAAAYGIWASETSRVRAVNNTLVNCIRGIAQLNPIPDQDRIVVQNNILTQMSGRALWFAVSGNHNSNNMFYGNAVNYYGQATPGPWEFGGDPMLDGSYHLLSGSPAINMGVDVGLPFQGPSPDLGAFETSSTAIQGGVAGVVRANLPGTPPLPNAQVQLPGGSVFGVSGTDGTYFMPLPMGMYSLEALAPAFQTATASGISVVTGILTTKDWLLDKGDWKTYYVDGVNGSDLNNGLSPATAWQSIGFGDDDDQLRPGDTVIVLPGTYYTTGYGFELDLDGGQPLAPITYKAQGPGVIIDGNNQAAWGVVLKKDYQDLDGFEFVNCDIAVDAVNSSHHEVRNCIVRDSKRFGLYSYGAMDVVYRNNLVVDSDTSSTGIYIESHTDFRAYNNTVVGGARGIYLTSSGTQAKIRNNIISGVTTGMQLSTGPVLHTNNLFWANGANYAGTAAAGPLEFNADPALDGSYKLLAGSPAIDAGVNVGLPFSGLAPDLGAYESSFSATPVLKHSIPEAKATAEGTWVTLDVAQEATAATGNFTDGAINIEAADRATGIRVLGATGVNLGDKITLTGLLGSDPSGEKIITASSVSVASSVSPLAALSLGNIELSDISQGPGTIGLLVRTWGRVTYVSGDAGYLYIDDGRNLNDGKGHLGVRVRLSGTSPAISPVPSEGDFVVVTGLAGLELDGTTVVPVVRPRSSADVTTL